MAEGQSKPARVQLRLELLGGFAASDGAGRDIAIGSRKAQALLAVLGLSPGQPQPRERLTALLWSDRGEAQARSSLRQALSELRRALPESDPPLLRTQRDTVWLDPEAIEVDAITLERLVSNEEPRNLAQAAELYNGDFLDGLDVRDIAFEEWRRGMRERLREQISHALMRLLDQQVGDQAIATARRLLQLDSLNEAVHRTLMQIYFDKGDRTLALKQYQACRDILSAELGVPPEPQTETLFKKIRAGHPIDNGEAVSEERDLQVTRAEPLPLPEKPSIAVLPFVNLSGDAGQEYFSDGITEDIITALAKMPGFIVISRNSTSTYKGQPVDVKRVSREQGVRHVLAGSVRKFGNRVRITAQLTDTMTGHHLWADRYDRDVNDIFAVQDEITREVAVAVDARLSTGQHVKTWSSGTKILEAWECVRLSNYVLDGTSRGSHQEAQRLCERALELDPKYAMAWVTLGFVNHHEVDVGVRHIAEEGSAIALNAAFDCAHKAIRLDPSCADAYALLGLCHLSRGEHDEAVAMSEKSVALAPSHADNIALSALVENKAGRPERSLALMQKAMRLCPIYPGWYLWALGNAYRLTGRLELAVDAFEAGLQRNPEYLGLYVGLASTLGELGRKQAAMTAVSEILRLDPDFSISSYMKGLHYRDEAQTARFEDGLRRAGLPK